MFSALRQGQPLYILEKGDDLSIKVGLVESVTQPRPEYGTYNPTVGFTGNMRSLVDITVKNGSNKQEFIGIPSNLSIHGNGDTVISESKDAMIAEIDGMLQSSKTILDSIEYHKKVVENCEKVLKQLNPEYAKQQERDEVIDDLKSEIENIRKDMADVVKLLTKTETN